MTIKPHSSPKNRIPLTFTQTVDHLLRVDPKKLPASAKPGTVKGKKKAAPKKAKKKG